MLYMANKNLFSSLLHPKSFNQKNGFDLSHRKVFACKAGELLPVLCEELYPTDYFEIDTATLLRTFPLQTAAFIRAKMCFDFFFVPKTCLWRRYNAFIAQRDDLETSYTRGFAFEPNISLGALTSYVNTPASQSYYRDYPDDRARILQLLGYGDGMKSLPSGLDPDKSLTVLPIMGYNRIYDYHYRNKWRDMPASDDMKRNNADWMDCSTYALSLYPSYNSVSAPYHLVQMHYHGWYKDLFMGSLPNQQFGVVSSVGDGLLNNILIDFGSSGASADVVTDADGRAKAGSVYSAKIVRNIPPFAPAIDTSFDVISLRNALALQKWKEYNMRAGWSADRQQQANFGDDLPSDSRHEIQFLDSYEAPVMVDEVLQSSPSAAISGISSSPSPVGDLAGKGVGFANGKKIKFEAKQPGYLYCIFYIMPEAEYDQTMIDPTLVASEPFDHYTPAFANTGMEAIHKWMASYKGNAAYFDNVLGYAPNGFKWKTRLDKAIGDFQSGGSLSSWVSVRKDLQLIINSGQLPLDNFYVTPSVLDSVFYAANDGTDATAQFLVNMNFVVNAVRPMPVLGLPSF